MHPYATDSSSRSRVPLLVATAAILGAFGLNRLIAAVSLSMPWWLDVPSAAGLYAGLYQWFDQHLWASEWLRKINLVDVPDLRGRWVGTIDTSHDSLETKIHVEIRQRWSRILITAKTKHSRSKSLTGSILLEPTGPLLLYEYLNEPLPLSTDTMEIHRGTAHLRLKREEEGEVLEGSYYTGRGRGTVGEMTLKRVEHDFV